MLTASTQPPNFNPRPPCGGRPGCCPGLALPNQISIHAPHAGGDRNRRDKYKVTIHFNPRPPCGGRPVLLCTSLLSWCISIHAPHAGGDPSSHIQMLFESISIHAPRAGGDRLGMYTKTTPFLFQSTPPVRGATAEAQLNAAINAEFQSTPPVRGATCEDADYIQVRVFQSTPPVRGATSVAMKYMTTPFHFNPRPPCGGRLHQVSYLFLELIAFQSTPPVRGATCIPCADRPAQQDFNPRPPCGGRPRPFPPLRRCSHISIHAPRAGGDLASSPWTYHKIISIHAPRAGGDRSGPRSHPRSGHFNPRPPCGGRPC